MKKLLVVLFSILISFSIFAEGNKPNVLGDYEIVISGTTAYRLPTAWVSGTTSSNWAMVFNVGDAIRFKSGTTPTSVDGPQLASGSSLKLESGSDILNFRFVLKSGGSGTTVYVIFYGPND